MAKKYPPEVIDAAKRLFIRGYTVQDISREIGIVDRTIYNWRDAGDWENYCPPDTIEIALARRINVLSERDKTPEELNEFIQLVGVFGKLQLDLANALKIKAQATALATGVSFDGGVPGEANFTEQPKKPAKRKEKTAKNDISKITAEKLDEVRNKLFFGYQLEWYERRYDPLTKRVRFILKSRQIGATFYFAFEALDNAIRTGDNQLFLSASRDQAEVFKAYIIAFAHEHFDVELKGQGAILLSNGAELRFLSTNSNTAQSYHGHLYIDEVFWIANYKKLNKVASGMAAHKKWCKTYFSTPSAMSHGAYEEWSGELYNKSKPEHLRVEFDTSHAALKSGVLGPDKKWRHMVTVEDAQEQGCDLFDIEELKLEYSKDDYDNLFMCKFIDDSQSAFSLAKLLECTVDVDAWSDYKPDSQRPFGNKPVSLGYDPSRTRDNADLATLAIPLIEGEEWRVLKTHSYHGKNFQYQSNRIKEVRDCHNVKHIGIDTTGIGYGVFELVLQWFPLATPINYSMEMKTQLVLKALDVINNGRFKYLAGDNEITRAFLMITQTTTGSGHITFSSSRSAESGHADKAWSIMHALNYEPLAPRRKTTVSFSN